MQNIIKILDHVAAHRHSQVCFFHSLTGRMTGKWSKKSRRGKRAIFHLLLYFPNGSNGQGWIEVFPFCGYG